MWSVLLNKEGYESSYMSVSGCDGTANEHIECVWIYNW